MKTQNSPCEKSGHVTCSDVVLYSSDRDMGTFDTVSLLVLYDSFDASMGLKK